MSAGPAPQAAPAEALARREGPPSLAEREGALAAARRARRDLHRDRLRRWIGIFSAYLTAQTLTQLLGIAAGLLFVRFMPVREFALYTLGTSVIAFFTFLSDLGSTSSLLYFFQRSTRAGESFQPYLGAVLSMRRFAFLLGAAAVVLLFPRVAAAKGFATGDTVLVTAGLVLAVWFQITSSVRLLALRLDGRYGRSYRAEVSGGAARLAATLLMIAAALLRAWIAMLATALAGAAVALLAAARPPARAPRANLAPYRRQVLRYLLPSLPSAFYFSLQGPLVVWLSATFGSTENIAEVGALGRLGLVVGIFAGLTGVVFLPRMAQIADDRLYRIRYLQYGGLLLALALSLLAAAAVAPGLFLLVLGPHYAGLQRELLLVVAGSGLSLLGGYAVAVNLARSWNRWESLAVLTLIAVQGMLVAALPLGTTRGVLLFNALSAAWGLAAQLAITGLGFYRPRLVQWMR